MTSKQPTELPAKPDDLAIFLDFDGTLADIEEDPSAVSLPTDTLHALQLLAARTGGAVAIVSGRAIEDIDRFVAPLVLPVAGIHGMARRGHDGRLWQKRHDDGLMAQAQERLTRLSAALPDTMIEIKPGSAAFHYRRRPSVAATIVEDIHDALGDLEGLDILHGKMVVEVKAGHANKGDAVAAFLDEPPFRGRIPIFAGDDTTDEFAFREVVGRGGITIKIGEGDTAAQFRMPSPSAFRTWLGALANS